MFALLQPDEENGNICGGHAGDATGLADGGGAYFFEPLNGFRFESVDGFVVDILRNSFMFKANNFFCLSCLPVDVAGVSDFRSDVFPVFHVELLPEFVGKLRPGVAGAAKPEVEGDTFVAEAGSFADAGIDSFLFLSDAVALFTGNEAEFGGDGREAQVGIVLPKEDAHFCAAGEHAVGFIGAPGDEVVDHDSNVCLVASEDEGRTALCFQGGVCSGDESLCGGFFIT